jgi:hypothetical protein
MKKVIAILFLVILIPMAADAVEDGTVRYAGGTVTGLKEGSIGKLKTSSTRSLMFDSAGVSLVIQYAKIDSYEYTHPVARHLGVLPAMAVGMVKKRQRRHFFRISYRDDAGELRVAIFEVPKQMPPVLLAILKTEAPHSCKPTEDEFCRGMK